jgi:signal transduction histidine kinase
MTTQGARDDSRLSAVFAPATPRDRRVTAILIVAIAAAFVSIAPIALTPLPRTDGFIPAVQSIIFATDFITAVLLFAHYATERSRALLFLACGYLFTAVIVAAQTLTFPGAFTPTGLFGAGPDVAAWLYVWWHLAIPVAAIAYASSKQRPLAPTALQGSSAPTIEWAALASIAAALVLIWAVIAVGARLPTLVVSETSFSSLASVVTAVPLAASVIAIVLLWKRRTSVLDEWLMVALSASIAETAIIVLVAASRYTLAFYTMRVFAMIVSSAVLVALLTDMTRLYVRLAAAVNALQRERATKLMNLDVVVGSVGHEIRQPLTVIRMCIAGIDSLLRKPRIEVDEVRENLVDISDSTVRIAETIENLRGLFRDPHEDEQQIEVNALVLSSLQTLNTELAEHDIVITRQLATDLPHVLGHKGQLREVFVNIVQNAIDAMTPLTDRPRALHVTTSHQRGKVTVTIRDSGPGIGPERLPSLFTAFISTKAFGMGLGLSICQMIVERHDGQLAVSSEVGKGSSFDVTLPADPRSGSAAPLSSANRVKAEA